MSVTVYKITNLINGAIYIGITSQPFRRRFAQHKWASKHRRFVSTMGKAIRKYGADAFWMSPVLTCSTRDQANAEEVRLIALWRPRYNLNVGGGSNAGYRVSEETRAKLSALSKGRPSPLKGVPAHPSRVAKLIAYNRTPEAKARFAANKQRIHDGCRRALSREVVCLNTGQVFSSLVAAAAACGTYTAAVANVCRQKPGALSANGFVFRYKADADKESRTVQEILHVAQTAQRTGKVPKRVIRVDTEKVYESVAAAASALGVGRACVRDICHGGGKYRVVAPLRFLPSAGAPT